MELVKWGVTGGGDWDAREEGLRTEFHTRLETPTGSWMMSLLQTVGARALHRSAREVLAEADFSRTGVSSLHDLPDLECRCATCKCEWCDMSDKADAQMNVVKCC